MLQEALASCDLRPEEIAGSDIEAFRRLTEAMPSADAHISRVTAEHRNPQTRSTATDIFDIDASRVAVTYCDVVVTERHATHLLRADGIADGLETRVLATLEELVDVLSS